MERNYGDLRLHRKGGKIFMNKKQFLDELRSKLVGLPDEEVDNRISFYEEMINDRIDEGKSEEEAINEIGTVDEVIREIAKDTPLVSLVKHKMKPKRRLRGWEVMLIIFSFPFWLPVAITAIALTFAAIVVMWSGAIAVYATEVSMIATFFWGIFKYIATGMTDTYFLGAALLGFGGTILMAFACVGITKGMFRLTRFLIIGIKSAFIRKKRR